MIRPLLATLLLTCFYVILLAPPGLTATDSLGYREEASALAALGILQGSEAGLQLDYRPTRLQGAVMLVLSSRLQALHQPPTREPFALPRVDANIPDIFPIYQEKDLQAAVAQSLYSLKPRISLLYADYEGNVYVDLERALPQAVAAIEQHCGVANLLQNWHYLGSEQEIVLHLNYRYTGQQLQQLHQLAALLCQATAGKDDYEQVKVFHDYLVNHANYYDNSAPPLQAYTAYGALLEGQAVCQGYAEAMRLLCHQAGIDSLLVTGCAITNGLWRNHAWNIIKIGDAYYHVDAVWDDPVIKGSGKPHYTYFLLNDQELSRDHQWDRTAYPACTSNTYNYFVLNKLLLSDYNEFSQRVKQALQHRVPDLVFKIYPFDPDDYGDLSQLILQDKQVTQFMYQIDPLHGIISIYNILYR